ncbi:uncharacterized protein LOC132264163 [Phlebotomus argentipes]|uniref:uncharacterized protein LOC132264163 n=1 Tax=Phlebotomus argentipes TaxID=94469 RepID=UPI002893667B|nr:uncharacterized protein LOC132264163 [Phlebotomus argentipes]
MDSSSSKLILFFFVLVFCATCQCAPPSLPVELTPEFFPTAESPLTKPIQSAEYVDFINKLYGHDHSKKPLTLDAQASNVEQVRDISEEVVDDHVREKRAIIFRPLFVYRQQQVRRQKIKDQRKKQQQQKPQASQSSSSSSKPSVIVPANTSHFIVYNNKIYQQYNPYYAPYQYGQKFPYQKW